jgi:hypothetical protein
MRAPSKTIYLPQSNKNPPKEFGVIGTGGLCIHVDAK